MAARDPYWFYCQPGRRHEVDPKSLRQGKHIYCILVALALVFSACRDYTKTEMEIPTEVIEVEPNLQASHVRLPVSNREHLLMDAVQYAEELDSAYGDEMYAPKLFQGANQVDRVNLIIE